MPIQIEKVPDDFLQSHGQKPQSCFNYDNEEIRDHHISTIIDRYTGYAEGLVFVKFDAMRKRALYYLQMEMIKEMEAYLGCKIRNKKQLVRQVHLLHFARKLAGAQFFNRLIFFFILPQNPAASTYALGYMLKEYMINSKLGVIEIPESELFDQYLSRYDQGMLYLKERWL